MKGNNIYVVKRWIDDASTSDLHIELYKKFNYDYDEHDDFIEIEVGGTGDTDNEPIDIDLLMEKIQKLKEKGATHISLDYHCDHLGYEISGYEIKAANDIDIQAYETKKLQAEDDYVRKRTAQLQAELNKLTNGK